MNRPEAIKKAMKIAKEAAGRRLSYDWLWITPVLNGYSIRYTLPNTEGFFACNEELHLTPEEREAYTEWAIENGHDY